MIIYIIKDKHYLRIKVWKKSFWSNGPNKQAYVAITISNNIDFKAKLFKRDGEKLFILLKERTHQNVSMPQTIGYPHL